MEGIIAIAAVVGLLVIVGLGYAYWCYRQDTKKRMAALKAVYEDHPEFMKTFDEFRRFARHYLRELGEETVTFTFNKNDA
jgi:flagellar basal body-associated protein FliL